MAIGFKFVRAAVWKVVEPRRRERIKDLDALEMVLFVHGEQRVERTLERLERHDRRRHYAGSNVERLVTGTATYRGMQHTLAAVNAVLERVDDIVQFQRRLTIPHIARSVLHTQLSQRDSQIGRRTTHLVSSSTRRRSASGWSESPWSLHARSTCFAAIFVVWLFGFPAKVLISL
jgi:hypothetical protein